MTMTVQQVLTSMNMSATEADVAELLWEYAAAAPVGQAATRADMAFLSEQGIDVDLEAGRRAYEQLTLQSAVADVAGTLSRDEMAAALGVDPTTVSKRAARGALMAWKLTARDVRYPRWQVAGGRSIPHLAELLDAIPEGTSPREVSAIMTAVDDDLDGMTRRDWLISGGDPAPVVGALASIGWL